MLHYIQLYCYH